MIRLSILFVFLTGCSTTVTLVPRGCSTKATMWGEATGNSFEVQKSYWLSPGESTVYLTEVLQGSGIECRNITAVSYEVKKEWDDFLLGLIPFIDRKTFVIKGFHTGSVLNEEQQENPQEG